MQQVLGKAKMVNYTSLMLYTQVIDVFKHIRISWFLPWLFNSRMNSTIPKQSILFLTFNIKSQ